MATRSECSVCEDTAVPRAPRFSMRRVLKIVAAIALAGVLMYGEIWAIQEGPVWAGADILEPTSSASGDTDTPIPDTAGPVAVLH
jgi:hypothetical protein